MILEAILFASISNMVPPQLLLAICKTESHLNPSATNFNDGQGRHSHGLCQVQTRTARYMGYRGPVKDLYNPYINAQYAAKYLKYQLDRYGGNWRKAVAAYNAGRAVKREGKFVNQDYVDQVWDYLFVVEIACPN